MWEGVTAPRTRACLALLLTAGLLLTACSGGGDDEPSAAPTSATPSASPSPSPTQAAVDPLLGVAPPATTPLVGVKIDNSPLARPYHRGLDTASLIYLELVEGGATRMLGLWSQPHDVEIGPIRSLRESDIELVAQYGKPALAFSGANRGVLATFRGAVQAGQVVEVSYENKPGLYRLAERRRDARNFFSRPSALAASAEGGQPARDMGLVFSPAPRPDAAPAGSARVVFSDRETWSVRYDPASGTYSVLEGGQALTGVRPVNVLVQQVPVRPSQYRDVTGAVTPYTTSTGTGSLQLLRDGTFISGTWQRPDAASPTRYLDGGGQPMALKPGATFVFLQPAGLPFSTG